MQQRWAPLEPVSAIHEMRAARARLLFTCRNVLDVDAKAMVRHLQRLGADSQMTADDLISMEGGHTTVPASVLIHALYLANDELEVVTRSLSRYRKHVSKGTSSRNRRGLGRVPTLVLPLAEHGSTFTSEEFSADGYSPAS